MFPFFFLWLLLTSAGGTTQFMFFLRRLAAPCAYAVFFGAAGWFLVLEHARRGIWSAQTKQILPTEA